MNRLAFITCMKGDMDSLLFSHSNFMFSKYIM